MYPIMKKTLTDNTSVLANNYSNTNDSGSYNSNQKHTANAVVDATETKSSTQQTVLGTKATASKILQEQRQ